MTSEYCARCDGYAAEVGKPGDNGLCPPCAQITALIAAGEAIVAQAAADLDPQLLAAWQAAINAD